MEAVAIIIGITLLAGWIAWLEFGGKSKEYSLDNDDLYLTSEYVHDITMLYSNQLIDKQQAHRYLGVDSFE